MLPTIAWEDGEVVMIDQRKLPSREVYVRCRTGRDVAKAIRTMVIRGAPAIGVAAAMGVALELRRSTATGTTQLATEFYRTCDLLAATRPTAVNLFCGAGRAAPGHPAAAQVRHVRAAEPAAAGGVRSGSGAGRVKAGGPGGWRDGQAVGRGGSGGTARNCGVPKSSVT